MALLALMLMGARGEVRWTTPQPTDGNNNLRVGPCGPNYMPNRNRPTWWTEVDNPPTDDFPKTFAFSIDFPARGNTSLTVRALRLMLKNGNTTIPPIQDPSFNPVPVPIFNLTGMNTPGSYIFNLTLGDEFVCRPSVYACVLQIQMDHTTAAPNDAPFFSCLDYRLLTRNNDVILSVNVALGPGEQPLAPADVLNGVIGVFSKFGFNANTVRLYKPPTAYKASNNQYTFQLQVSDTWQIINNQIVANNSNVLEMLMNNKNASLGLPFTVASTSSMSIIPPPPESNAGKVAAAVILPLLALAIIGSLLYCRFYNKPLFARVCPCCSGCGGKDV